ncbi:MAG: hypothetical protein GY854_07055 [Deltaproteobacteria bacterium]|nr:hypothetical protein [Deltaproteobacteria bacterium]
MPPQLRHADDDSGAGRNFRMVMNADWAVLNKEIQPWIRLYRDRMFKNGVWDDPDIDGLSSTLEALLGTGATKWDSDLDGILDGLEVYGPVLPVKEATFEAEPDYDDPTDKNQRLCQQPQLLVVDELRSQYTDSRFGRWKTNKAG